MTNPTATDKIDGLASAATSNPTELTSYFEEIIKPGSSSAIEIATPRWEDGDRGLNQDWRVFIPESIRQVWDQLPGLSKIVAYVVAEDAERRDDRGKF